MDDVNAILARAVELEKTGASNPGAVGSLSLRELEEVAEEVGIGSALVEAAAADVGGPTRRSTDDEH